MVLPAKEVHHLGLATAAVGRAAGRGSPEAMTRVERRVREAEEAGDLVGQFRHHVFAHRLVLDAIRPYPSIPHSTLIVLQLVVDFEEIE